MPWTSRVCPGSCPLPPSVIGGLSWSLKGPPSSLPTKTYFPGDTQKLLWRQKNKEVERTWGNWEWGVGRMSPGAKENRKPPDGSM